MPPTMLINALEAVRRRVKVLGVAYGAGIVLAIFVAALLTAVSLDFLLNLPALPRLLLMAGALSAIGYTVWTRVIRPSMAKLSLTDIAGKLERAFPQFDDRLRSTIDFVQHKNPGSEAMQQRVVGEAASLASSLDLRTAVLTTPAIYSLAVGIGAVVLLSIISATMSPAYRSVAIARLLSPFATHEWPKRTRIDLVDAPPARVPVGQHLDLRMKLGKGDRESAKAIVFYQYDDGVVQQEFMTRGADGTYAVSLDARVESGKSAAVLKAWIRAGDDEKRLEAVTVVPRLAIQSFEAQIDPPAYVEQRHTTSVNLANAPAVMAAGSSVTLHATFNKPLAHESLPQLIAAREGASDLPTVLWSVSADGSALGKFVAEKPARFRLHATDIDGFSSSEFEEYELIVRPDQMPSVQIESPRRNEERTANAVVPLEGLAEDDYGISALSLQVDRITDKKHWDAPLVEKAQPAAGVDWTREDANGERMRYRAAEQWDLATLDSQPLKPGDMLEYSLAVTDNYRAADGSGHDPVSSGKLRITIISPDEMTTRIVEEVRLAKDQLIAIEKTQARTKIETANLANDTKDKPAFDAADRAVNDRLAAAQSTAASQTKALASRMDAIGQKLEENKLDAKDLKDLARDVKAQLDNAAEDSMKDATQSLNNASQSSQKSEPRSDALNKAQAEQTKADEQLNAALDRMSNIGTMSQTIDRIAALLAEQKDVSKQTSDAGKGNVGKKPDDMPAEDRKKLDDAANRQEKLADRTGKAMDELQKLADQLAKSDPSASQAMSGAAKTGQSQQVQSKQQQASKAAKENQQANAQQAQKGAEMGLETMLNQLREAERNKLAELSKKLEEMQKQIALLIRRQAGHNLDNVMSQKLDFAADPMKSTAGDLTAKAERDPASTQPSTLVAPPAVDQQEKSQELTERNTRDISKAVEAAPNGAEPAGNLVRAADKMERAIFALRDSKLPEAYDPAQVEALAALDAAKKLIDQQKAKVDEQIGDTDREAVRAKYQKIKDDQVALNLETARLDKARDPAGELARKDGISLGKLPGEQGKLSDRVSDVEKDLSAVGSIVYIWSNKDIVRAMNDVKSDLGKPDTGADTQAGQARVVAQLDAMIRDLTTKPKESKFAQDGGGGSGGGQSGPKLPAEAELRLLKDLQAVVNTNTKIADAAPAKDKQQLLDLGTRQGELRNLLDQLIQKSSNGQAKLGPEPDKKSQLPEEAGATDVDNQELDQSLLNDKPAADEQSKETNLIGDRMARSRQRLALNDDPGKVTQTIQDRIVKDLDDLIEQARQQTAQKRNQPDDQKKSGEQMKKPGAQVATAANQGKQPGKQPKPGALPAGSDTTAGPPASAADLSKAIKENSQEWGKVTPRFRDAVIDGADDQVVEEYRKLVEDYYKALSSNAKDR